jgi:hypothetical protein
MLEKSFSFLPVFSKIPGDEGWKLLSDFSLVRYLRESKSHDERKERLAKQIGKVVEAGDIKLAKAAVCGPEEPISNILDISGGQPVLVVGLDHNLRGIITPFDLL